MTEHDPALWLPVVGYEGFYEVSSHGEVRSVERRVNAGRGRQRIAESRILRPAVTATGRLTVSLSRNGKPKSHLVHRLVALAFLGPAPKDTEVCHNDGDASNNQASNLRWDTHAANMLDTIGHGINHNTQKTHCPKGHPYSGTNLQVLGGRRKCRTCRSEKVPCACGEFVSKWNLAAHRRRCEGEHREAS